MEISRVWSRLCHATDLLMMWFCAWFVILLIVLSPIVFFSESLPKKGFEAVLLVAIAATLIAAVYDLLLRVRGHARLITLFLAWLSRLGRSRIARAIFKICKRVKEYLAMLFAPVFLAIEKGFTFIVKVVGALLLIAIAGLLAYWLFGVVAALPVSVAVIIGAVIIANAAGN